ncbi:A-kinase anchor protein 8-like isoform X1 [Erpetoichthys calabaricus]|uniref:A-kinase anchor protein 8-like isoform X1 n=1 Tax=Erpetoichthys calabaricus TaxID=27687 RepID=UPI00109F3E53|nr:A-kinase anchor protein 8-like isoform X1 [Erpetoichthys calabaricus]
MEGRGYGSGYGGSAGYSSWNSGAGNRGSGGYDSYSYGYGQESSRAKSFGGYGMHSSKSWDSSKQGGSATGSNADAAIAKINQKLDILSQLQGNSGPMGGGSRQAERFDQYESYDSRSTSLNNRDLYRSGYGYSEGGTDFSHHRGGNAYGAGRFDNSYGSNQPQNPRLRENFGQSWAGRGIRGMGTGRGFGRWNEPLMGARGPGAIGSPGAKLPSLLSPNVYPEMGMFSQGMQGFSGNKRFGAGAGLWAGRQRVRRRAPNRQMKVQKDGKKRKSQNSGDEPESKMGKMDASDSENEEKASETGAEEGEAKPKAEGEGAAEGDDALTMQEEINQIKRKLQANKQTQEKQKRRQRNRLIERVQFTCSICRFRSFYDDEMKNHLESKFHKEHFKFLTTKLSKPTADFLQEYVLNKSRRAEDRRKHIENLNAAIAQIYKEQDLTQELGMGHFVRKVEAAHCAACDLFIPMQVGLIQKHLKTPEHNINRKAMMEQSKRTCLSVARSILNHKVISKKLEQFLKGENPFTDDADDKGEEKEAEGGEDKTEVKEADGGEDKAEGKEAEGAEGEATEGEAAAAAAAEAPDEAGEQNAEEEVEEKKEGGIDWAEECEESDQQGEMPVEEDAEGVPIADEDLGTEDDPNAE